MREFELTVKNYRCFQDINPLKIRLGDTSVAFVGPNNCGKSIMLKFFYELNKLWTSLGQDALGPMIRDRKIDVRYEGVEDPYEIFCNFNDRNISIEIDMLNSDPGDTRNALVRSVTLTCNRSHPVIWSLKMTDTKGQQSPHELIEVTQDYFKAKGLRHDVTLTDFRELMSAFRDTLYIGPFRNALSQGQAGERHYGLSIGADFINEWNSWKSGGDKSKSRAIIDMTNDISRIFGFNKLEINASDDRKTFQVIIDDTSYRLRELGSGMAQIIIVLANAAIRKPSFILIDEPELNLHPTLQMDFMNALSSYSKYGVVFATHSVGLARSCANKIYSCQKDESNNDSILVREFEKTPNYIQYLGELSYSLYQDLGFNKILLVEGKSDIKTYQQFLKKYGIDHKVVIVPLGGETMINAGIDQELRELNRLAPGNIFVIIDSERKAAGDALSEPRRRFLEICCECGFVANATDRRAIENYFTTSAVKLTFGGDVSALDQYVRFDGRWPKRDNWRIAKQMGHDDIDNTDIGEFIRRLKADIEG